ncbi:MAG: helix-turn-helix domain-containing protein [Planctomycetes bacterium]|nr:helix-turn-helix domain-containing protein [Planctomycetota bacterium]
MAERVTNTLTVPARLAVLEGALEEQLLSEKQDPILTDVLRTVSACRGSARIESLARLAGWSPRRLRRVFHEGVGVGPKMFCEIVQFNNALRVLGRPSRPDLLDVALEAGYYDQAHFIHGFQRFYGSSPSTVLRHPER